MSDQTPFRGTVNLEDLGGFELTITFNGLIAVRHIPCGTLMILKAGVTDLPGVVSGAINHTCSATVPEIPDYTAPKTSYTDHCPWTWWTVTEYAGTTTVYARVPRALKAEVDQYAEATGKTLAAAVTELLGEGLNYISNRVTLTERVEKLEQAVFRG